MLPTDIRTIVIYEINNRISGKSYVGSTFNGFFGRLSQHIGRLEKGDHPNSKFQKEWNKSKIIDWDFRILEYEVTQQDAKKREEYWIKERGGINMMPKSCREVRGDRDMYVAMDLRDIKMSYREIGEKHGIALGTVCNIAHKFGLRRRYDVI